MKVRVGIGAIWILAMAILAVIVTGSWWAALFVYLATFEITFNRKKRNPIRELKAWVDSHNDGGDDGKCKRCGSKMDFDHAGWLCPNGCPTHTW